MKHDDVIKICMRDCQSPNLNSANIYFWPLGGHFAREPGNEATSLCEGNCSHYYFIQPVSAIDCNPLGANLPLTCGVYVPRINPTTVRWYWTGSGELAGASGIWITDGSPGYSLTAAQSSDPIVNGVYIGLFYDQYSLTVLSFNSSDLGYYWCQIVINDTVMLQPSQFLNISVPAVSSTQCLNSAFLFYDFGETCADSNTPTPLLQPMIMSTTSLPQVTTVVSPAVTSETFNPLPILSDPANSRAQFTTVASSAISSRVTVSVASETHNILPSSPAPANPTGMNHSSMCCDVVIYISIGTAVLIGTLAIMCLVIVTVCCICIIAREQTRKQKMRQQSEYQYMYWYCKTLYMYLNNTVK